MSDAGKPLSVEEAIKTAMEFETKVRDTYAEAVEKANDQISKKVFGILAKEEQGHLDYLEHRLKELHDTGKVNASELPTVIPTAEVIKEKTKHLEKTVHSSVDDREIEMLKQAFEAEKTTSGFYREMVATMKDEEQVMFQKFLEIEEGHVAIVQAELNAAMGFGAFFDFEEFNLEAG